MLIRIIVGLLLIASPAYAQKSKAVLQSEITTSFPDNTTGAITPAIVRSVFNDFVNSWQQYAAVNPQTGTTYTIQASDYGQLITFNNSNAISVTLPQATGSFSTFNFTVKNLGNSAVTITPTASTINGASNFILNGGQTAYVVSDGTNYQLISSSLLSTLTVAITDPNRLISDPVFNGGSTVNNLNTANVTTVYDSSAPNTAIHGLDSFITVDAGAPTQAVIGLTGGVTLKQTGNDAWAILGEIWNDSGITSGGIALGALLRGYASNLTPSNNTTALQVSSELISGNPANGINIGALPGVAFLDAITTQGAVNCIICLDSSRVGPDPLLYALAYWNTGLANPVFYIDPNGDISSRIISSTNVTASGSITAVNVYATTITATSTIAASSLISTTTAPNVQSSQIGYGGTHVASSSCGTLSGANGCVVINVGGTQRYVPYY